MKFGSFDDDRREYVIDRPDTPLPWINYLGSESFFGLISNTGGGYCFYRDARMRRLTRYRYNNIPADSNGRYFFIREADGSFWSPTWQPIRDPLDHYQCRHGLGYTKIRGCKDDLAAECTYFVPLGETVEVHRLRLSNQSDRSRSVQLFSFIEFCLWNADEDDRNFQRNLSIGEVEVAGSTLFHKTEYRERRNHFAYYTVNRPIDGFDTDRASFLGPYGSLQAPAVVVKGAATGSLASGWSPIASHQLDLEIPSGAEVELIFLLGYAENPGDDKFSAPGVIRKKPAEEQIARLGSPEAAERELKKLADYWTEILSPYQIRCQDEKLARMVNIWNPYQCMVTFNLSRSASYFESGIGRGMGFRDSNQDLLGFVHQVPDRARERILDIAATQLRDGGACHQYQPLTKKGNADIGGNFNDDPLWLILGVGAYVRETGDRDILDHSVDFENDPELAAPLLEHLMRSFRFTVNHLGPHGLPLIGRADWNDCLNLNCFSETPGEPFQTTANREGATAESLMIAGLFIYACRELIELLEAAGETSAVEEIRRAVQKMRTAVDAHGRDARWFLRAYDFFGNKVGSEECEDGKIYVESQGWCVMAGLGHDDGFARRALDTVREHLATSHGIVLQDPPYAEYHVNLGEVSSYPPGYKENGGVFCHTNPWIMIAETMLGNAGQAFDYYRRVAPAYREEMSEIHRCEPYVYAQMIAGKAAQNHGEAKNSWLTGTASWNYVAITQFILGIRPGFKGLIVDPCYPDSLGEIQVVRYFKGVEYRIRMRPKRDKESPRRQVDQKDSDEVEIEPRDRNPLEVDIVFEPRER